MWSQRQKTERRNGQGLTTTMKELGRDLRDTEERWLLQYRQHLQEARRSSDYSDDESDDEWQSESEFETEEWSDSEYESDDDYLLEEEPEQESECHPNVSKPLEVKGRKARESGVGEMRNSQKYENCEAETQQVQKMKERYYPSKNRKLSLPELSGISHVGKRKNLSLERQNAPTRKDPKGKPGGFKNQKFVEDCRGRRKYSSQRKKLKC